MQIIFIFLYAIHATNPVYASFTMHNKLEETLFKRPHTYLCTIHSSNQ